MLEYDEHVDELEEVEGRSVGTPFSPALELQEGPGDNTPEATKALEMALLHEPSPCDDCCWRESCADGMACRTFYLYTTQRVPRMADYPPDVERQPTRSGWKLIEEGKYWNEQR